MPLAAGAADKLETVRRSLSAKDTKRAQVFTVVAVKDPLIGQLLASRFQLQEMIGQGAMAVVYKAKQTAVDRFVAVKIMRPELATDPVQVKRFQREARSLSKLDHPNLLKIFDIGQTPTGRPYFIMEYLKGRSIEKMLEESGPVQPAFALKMFLQVCDAMDHAHRQGIIHRDLKPENIMLVRHEDNQHLTKVVDFGIVKYTDDQMVSQRLTKTGEVWGSPVYMSPEQCKGEKLDPRSDIYSLGLVMYEALTGEMTFDATKIAAIIVKQIYEVPKPFKEIRPDLNIDPQLEAIVFKCLEKDPNNRYQSMVELKNVLKRAQDAEAKRTSKQSGSYMMTNPSVNTGGQKTTISKADNLPNTSQMGAVSPSRTTQQQAQAEPGARNNMVPLLVICAVLLTLMFCATAFGAFMLWRSSEDAKQREHGSRGGTINRDGGSSSGTTSGSGSASGSSSSGTTTTTTGSTTQGTQTSTPSTQESTGTVPSTPRKQKRKRRNHSGGGGGGGYSGPPPSELDYLEQFQKQPN